MIEIHITQLINLSDDSFINEFLDFPFKIRKEEFKNYVPSKEMTKQLINWGFYNGSIFWLIKDSDNQTVLRLALRMSLDKLYGSIGFIEIDLSNKNAKEYLKQTMIKVEDFFREKNISQIFAPIDLNTWFPYRFSIQTKKFYPRFRWEPTTPPEYLELFEFLGYERNMLYKTVFFPIIRFFGITWGAGNLWRSYKRMLKNRFTCRPFNLAKFSSEELPIIFDISKEAFKDAYLFESIDYKTFSSLYTAGATQYDFSPSRLLISPDNKIVGFMLAYFDGDYYIIKSIAILKSYQGLKVSAGLIYSGLQQAIITKKKYVVSALFRIGISSETITKANNMWGNLTWNHLYVLLKKELKK